MIRFFENCASEKFSFPITLQFKNIYVFSPRLGFLVNEFSQEKVMSRKINHIGIAVNSIDAFVKIYRDVLGLEYAGEEIVEDQKVKVAFFNIGESRIELLEPTSPESSVAKFLEKKGEGLHHLAVSSDDVEADIAQTKEKGLRMIDEVPRGGAHHTKIAFVHPKETKVLIEFTEETHH